MTHDLLVALINLDERTRDLDDRQRSTALAVVGGILRAVAYRGVPPATAAVMLNAFGPQSGVEPARTNDGTQALTRALEECRGMLGDANAEVDALVSKRDRTAKADTP